MRRRLVFGTGAQHRGIRQADLRDALLEEDRPPQQWLEQDDPKRRAQHREHDAGQSGSGADVDEHAALRQQFRHNRAVKQVPVPQALRLARADQAARNAVGSQQLRIPARLVKRAAEDIGGLGGYGGCHLRGHRGPPQPAGKTTTRRFGSSPSDSLRSPASATASWIIFRSNGDMARSFFGSPVRDTSAATERPSSASSIRRRARKPPTSSMSLARVPVLRCTARRVSSCSASSTSPSSPTSSSSVAPTTDTTARSPSTSMSMSPSRSAMSRRPSM